MSEEKMKDGCCCGRRHESGEGCGCNHENGEGCGCGCNHENGEGCGCGCNHENGEGCGCGCNHENGEGCGCGCNHENGEGCGCGCNHENGEGCGCGCNHENGEGCGHDDPCREDEFDYSKYDVELPKPTLIMIATTLAQQAMVSMGVLPNPATGKSVFLMHQATYLIDSIDVLYQKTAGNRTEEETKTIANIMSELRMLYVKASEEKRRRESSKKA